VKRGSARRRLRIRRRRKGETFSKILDVPDVVDLASAVDVTDVADLVSGVEVSDIVSAVDGPIAAEVIGNLGCCVVEAVGSLAAVLALLTVPVYLLLR
jgi:hypothetical protein